MIFDTLFSCLFRWVLYVDEKIIIYVNQSVSIGNENKFGQFKNFTYICNRSKRDRKGNAEGEIETDNLKSYLTMICASHVVMLYALNYASLTNDENSINQLKYNMLWQKTQTKRTARDAQ